MTLSRSPVMTQVSPPSDLCGRRLERARSRRRSTGPFEYRGRLPRGTEGQPSLYMVLEVLEGVPRCTELTLKRNGGGRGTEGKTWAVDLDSWIETFVSLCSGGPIKGIS